MKRSESGVVASDGVRRSGIGSANGLAERVCHFAEENDLHLRENGRVDDCCGNVVDGIADQLN